MGIAGAALATVLSQALAMTLVLLCLSQERSLPVQLHWRELNPDMRLLWRITRIGLPTGIQSTMFDLSNLLIQASVNYFGTSTITAWTAYSNISLVFWMTVSAMGTTITTGHRTKLQARASWTGCIKASRVGLRPFGAGLRDHYRCHSRSALSPHPSVCHRSLN